MFESRMGKRILLPLVAVAAAGMISGCAERNSIVVGAVPDDYRTRHPIVVSEQEKTLDLPVGMLSYRMTPQQKVAIDGFLDGYGESGPTVVSILKPQGSINAAAASRVAEDFAAFLHKRGVPEGYLQTVPYQASAQQPAPIRLSYSRLAAATGQCGRWPEDLLETHENRNYANFGCSYQNNLAAQIANPTDLLGPRKVTPIDAENRGSAIDDYKGREIADDFWAQSEIRY